MNARILDLAKRFVDRQARKTIAGKFSGSDAAALPLDKLRTMAAIAVYDQSFDTLIDVGAYQGWFAQAANACFRIDKTLCFEPNSEYHAKILANTQGFDVNVHGVALGSAEGSATFWKHQDPTMNSIVAPNRAVLKSKFPYDNPEVLVEESTKVATLDGYISSNDLQIGQNVLLKMDTQGNELDILKESVETLKKTAICLVEQMFVEAYQSSYDFLDLLQFMKSQGFRCVGPAFTQFRQSGEVSSADFLFCRVPH